MSLHDAEATRRVGALLRFLAPFFSAGPEPASTTWEPHSRVTAGAYAAGVFASRWALPAGSAGSPFAHNATAYTLIAQGADDFAGPVLPAPCDGGGALFFDLYAGAAEPLAPAPSPDGGCALPLALEAGGYGAVLALAAADASPPPGALVDFLARMAQMSARPLASYDTAPVLLQQTMTPIAPAPLVAAPAGAVAVAGSTAWYFAVGGTMIEGRDKLGNDVQFPWEGIAVTDHAPHAVDVPNLFVDVTPVTNAAYASFLQASGYAPSDAHNFLRDWNGSATPPSGWANKPVTWVDLLDARAFCAHAGKRLPHDWEWQYIAQGGDLSKTYPWGNVWDTSRLPPRTTGPVRPPPPDVGSVPAGDTPSGVKDLMGLVWQWTDEFTDDHTRAGLVRGGGPYYAPTGYELHDGNWYFPSYYGPLPIPPYTSGVVSGTLLTHGKVLLMSPSYDRHGTVGFRCVADAPGVPPPAPPCTPGVDHPNSDLPGMPLYNTTADACGSLCTSTAECGTWVFIGAMCLETPNPSMCYLKAGTPPAVLAAPCFCSGTSGRLDTHASP